jgi:parallel beta-helix repeat protein
MIDMKNRSIFIRRGLSLISCIIFVILFAGTVNAATLTVDDSGGASYTTIQAAINAASTGDTILVYSGTYSEQVAVNKQLVLIGVDNGGGKPIISGGAKVVTLSVNGITFDGFVVTNGNIGIYVTSSNNRLKNNTVQSNIGVIGSYGVAGGNGYGIYTESGAANNNFANNIVQNNIGGACNGNGWPGGFYGGNGYGVYLNGDASNNFTENIVQNNTGSVCNNGYGGNGYGIYMGGGATNNNFANNIVQNNDGAFSSGIGYGVYLSGATNNNFANNVIQGSISAACCGASGYGLYLISSNNNAFINNTIMNNAGGQNQNFGRGGNGYGIFLDTSIDNTFSFNTIKNNYGVNGGWWGNSGDGYGIYMSGSSMDNIIYNNYLNNTNNAAADGSVNTWNTIKSEGINIVSGPFLGGNFWASPSGTGYSQTCLDVNGDGICDSPYILDGNNIDYLPLSENLTPITVYNNYFTGNSNFGTSVNTRWNITKTLGTNVVGGPYLGGNYWANSNGTGYSQTCADADRDGICDFPYTVGNDTDYLPLTLLDITPPASVTNLHNVSYAPDFINWVWGDPSDTDFDHVMVYIDGIFRTNISKGIQSYNATGLALDTSYTISTHTVDSSGNINLTWINNTAMTDSPLPSSAGITTDGDGKYTSAPLDLGKNVTFASIRLSGRGVNNRVRLYTSYRADGTSWSDWTQATKSSDDYTVASGEYGRYFAYIIIAPAGVIVTKSTIDYVESPNGVIEIK